MKYGSETTLNKIRQSIGKVSFQYTGAEGRKKGILKDRAIVFAGVFDDMAYWHVMDLIEFPDESDRFKFRFGYYREYEDGSIGWSRAALTTTPADWKKLFVQAAKTNSAFKKFLQDVMAEL